MTLFLGWDVGGWNCDGGKSQDALVALEGTAFLDLRLIGVWRGNLRRSLVETECPGALLTRLPRLGEPTASEVVVAIDTPLGWPAAFTSLLDGTADVASVTDKVIENPYVFRKTEMDLVARGLFPEGRTPLSAVRDMLGSQSSKGIFFLRKSAMTQARPAVWRAGAWTAIETYPTPVRTSVMLREHFRLLRAEADFVKRSALGKNAAADLDDGLWCALVAATWVYAPTSLVWPPQDDEAVKSEGWIRGAGGLFGAGRGGG